MAAYVNEEFAKSLERFSNILTFAELQEIQTIQNAPLPTGLRLNSLKSNPALTIQSLADRYGWDIEPITYCNNGWLIKSAATPPGTTIEHRMGSFYLQDAASMIPVSLLEFDVPNPIILDMAASPGGKTTHLIDRSLDRGFVIANDGSQSRIPALRSVISNWGGINQIVTNFPGESFGKWFPETFDIILLDAPCSMENLRPTPAHPLRDTSVSERLRLQERQIQLLISGLNALKIGGQLIYATCSLAPEEDEAVVNRVLEHFPGDFVVDDVSDKLPFKVPGLTAFDDQAYDPSLKNTLRLWPHLTGMSGFFCARLKKISPMPITTEAPPSRDFSRTQLQNIIPVTQNQILNQIKENFGFELESTISAFNLNLFFRHENIFLIPTIYYQRFNTLPFEYIGMRIGQWINEKFHPSHEFVSRFGHEFTRGKIKLNSAQIPQWLDGRDIRNPQVDLRRLGQYFLVSDEIGRNLSAGKLLPKRLRNLLPHS